MARGVPDCRGTGRINHNISTWPGGAVKGMLMDAILLLDVEEDVLRFSGRTWDKYDEQIEAVLWNIDSETLASALLNALKECNDEVAL